MNSLRELIERRGALQEDVAGVLGVTQSCVSQWVREIRLMRLSPREAIDLCNFLECTIEDLAAATSRLEQVARGEK